MSNNSCNLYTFPDSEIEALAILYMQNQDLKGKSVREIAEIYYNAYFEFMYNTKDIKAETRNKFNK